MTLGEIIANFREKQYPAARNAIAEAILGFGGKGTSESGKEYFHRKGNYILTKRFGNVLPPQAAANLVDAAYLGNETLSGTLGSMIGKPFFSDYGFRWGDVSLNRQGQDKAIAELEVENALKRAGELELLRRHAIPFGGKE